MHGVALASAPLAAMAAAVVLAGATQRVTGVGFALVSAPLLVLGAGPVTGVLLANLLSLGTNMVVLAQTWRQIRLRRVVMLVIPAVCCVPVGQAVARMIAPGPLMIGVGLLVLTGLALMVALPRLEVSDGAGSAVVAGAASGLMNVTAGVGGPAIAIYEAAVRWEQSSFVGYAQLYFAALNVASVTAKGVPRLPWNQLAILGVALAAGFVIGSFSAGRIPFWRARQATLALAGLGAAATVVRGILTV